MSADNVLENLPNGKKETSGAEINCIYTNELVLVNVVAPACFKNRSLKPRWMTGYYGGVSFQLQLKELIGSFAMQEKIGWLQ